MITAAIGREQPETPTSIRCHLCQRRLCQGDATSWEGPRIHRGIRHDLSQTPQPKNRSVAVRLVRLDIIVVQFEAFNRSLTVASRANLSTSSFAKGPFQVLPGQPRSDCFANSVRTKRSTMLLSCVGTKSWGECFLGRPFPSLRSC